MKFKKGDLIKVDSNYVWWSDPMYYIYGIEQLRAINKDEMINYLVLSKNGENTIRASLCTLITSIFREEGQ